MLTNITLQSHKQLFQLLALALCIFTFVGMFMVGTATTAYCADPEEEDVGDVADTIQSAFSQMTKKIYDVMRAIIVPCCIVALAFAGFQFLVGGSQGAEKARKVVTGAILAVCFVVFAPLVMNTVGGMVTENGTGDWDDYNPLLEDD